MDSVISKSFQPSVIKVRNLKKYYRVFKKEQGIRGSIKSLFYRKYYDVKAVDNVSFEIKEGELVGFIGPNGAGKTTTLKVLSGLLYPTGGNASVLGFTPYERKKEFLENIALVMGQKNQLWWDLPPIDSFLLQKEIYNLKDSDFKKILSDLTNLLNTEDLLKVPVKKLSLGQRMKMELIASLLHTPKILFLDEPTIGLDIVMQKNLRDFIKEYNKKYKSTIILTSHYMGDVEELAKRIIIINHGKILYDGLLSSFVKKLAPHKIIRAVLKNPVNPQNFKQYGELVKYEYPELILRVNYRDTSEITHKILKDYEIHDLNIENPDVEDVIRSVFKRNA